MTFDHSALTITTYTNLSSDRGTYTLELKGTLSNYPNLTRSVFFTYNIINCDIGFSYPTSLPTQVFVVGDITNYILPLATVIDLTCGNIYYSIVN